jgi:hypothetical protein
VPRRLALVEAEIRAERACGRRVLWLGDTNTRCGNSELHKAEDKGLSSPGRVLMLQRTLSNVNMCPLHGRPGAPPARITSVPVGTSPAAAVAARQRGKPLGGEVDMIAGDVGLREGPPGAGDYVLVRTQRYGDGSVPAHPGPPRHVALMVQYNLQPQPVAGDGTAPPPPAARAQEPPAHGDPVWHAAAAAPSVLAGIDDLEALGQQALNGADPVSLWPRAVSFLTACQAECAGHKRSAAAPARHRHRGRAHRDCGDGRRRWQAGGLQAQPELVAARLAVARQRKRCRRLRAAAAAAAFARPQSRAHAAAVDAAQLQFRRLSKLKARACKRSLRASMAQEAEELADRRRRDAHSAARHLKRECPEELFASQGRPFIPDAPDGTPATASFHAHITKLVGGINEPDVPAVAEAAALPAGAEAHAPGPPPAPPPPAARMHAVPQATVSGAYIAGDVPWQTVAVCAFGPHPEIQHCCINGAVAAGTTSPCPICAAYNRELQLWRPGDPHSPAPEFPTRLRTSKAAGPDGIAPEFLCWLRPQAVGERLEMRARICKGLAAFFTAFVRAGKVPDVGPLSFKAGVSAALLKAVKPGEPAPERWQPNNYRFITMGNVLAKLFGTVLLTRLSHWSRMAGLTSPTQAAFQPGRSCEQHVISLMEVLKARRRAKLPTWMVFVDFRKAYDTVNHKALWAVARRAGVPEAIVKLLEDWNHGRSATLRINGRLSEPYPIGKGVPQGDVLSPWLFNLYIESLVRTIQANGDYSGVEAFGLRFKELLYADDLALFCADRGQAETALGIVVQWCRAWGLEVGVGAKKTEAMVFGDAEPAGGHAPLAVDGLAPVPVAAEYRYLGHIVEQKLEYQQVLERYAQLMTYNYNRFFAANPVMDRLPLRDQLIHLRTFVLSCCNFLGAAMPALAQTEAAKLDKKITEIARRMFGLPGKSVHAVLWQESAARPTASTWVRERTRVFLEACTAPTRMPLTPLHAILAAQGLAQHQDPDTWLAQTVKLLQQHGITTAAPPAAAVGPLGMGMPPQQCTHLANTLALRYCAGPRLVRGVLVVLEPREASTIASLFARDVAAHAWATKSWKAVDAKDRTTWQSHGAGGWSSRPPPAAKAFHMWANCGFMPETRVNAVVMSKRGADVTRARTGAVATCTPMSLLAPGGGGNVAAISGLSSAQLQPLIHARLGTSANYHVRDSVAELAWLRELQAAGEDVGADVLAAAEAAAAAGTVVTRPQGHCTACRVADAPGDTYHYLVECTHPTCAAARARIPPLVLSMARGIATGAQRCQQQADARTKAAAGPSQEAAALSQLAADVQHITQSLLPAHWHDTATGRTLLARLSLALPWSLRDLPPDVVASAAPVDKLATALGRIFDGTSWPAHMTQRMCRTWTHYALKAVGICNAARDATHPHRPAVRRGGAQVQAALAARRTEDADAKAVREAERAAAASRRITRSMAAAAARAATAAGADAASDMTASSPDAVR